MSTGPTSSRQNWYGAAPLHASSETVATGVELLRLSGDLDLDTSADAEQEIRARLTTVTRMLLLDLSAVTFCSSSGLRVLVEALHAADDLGIELRIVGAGRPVLRPLEVTGLDRYLHSYDSISSAVAGGRRPGSGS